MPSGFNQPNEVRRFAFGATVASMIAYLTAQFTDVYVFHFWKRVTKGKHLWLRNNGSTWISQFFDTIIVNSIFLGLGLKLPWNVVWQVIVANYIFKLILAALDTPLIYLGVSWLKRSLGIAARPDSTAA